MEATIPQQNRRDNIKTREVTIDVHMQGRFYKPWEPNDVFVVPRLRNAEEGANSNDETIEK